MLRRGNARARRTRTPRCWFDRRKQSNLRELERLAGDDEILARQFGNGARDRLAIERVDAELRSRVGGERSQQHCRQRNQDAHRDRVSVDV